MSASDARRSAGSDVIGVDLVGGLRVRVGGTVLGPRQLGGTKPRRLLLALVLSRGVPVSKERLVSMLWDADRPVACTATLETYVCVLRKRLQPASSPRTSPIETRSGCYSIDMSRLDLDTARHDDLASAALDPAVSPEAAVGRLHESLAVAAWPLLPGEASIAWLDDARRAHEEQVRQRLVAAAEKVAPVAPEEAARWARTALDIDPLDEQAWHAYLLSKVLSGEHAAGLRAYDTCRRLLADELGCAPGPRLQALYVRLLGGVDGGDEELGSLIDAVVRLHHAHRAASVQGSWSLPGEGPSGISVDQARRSLTALLRRAPAQRPRLVHSASA